MFLALKTNIPEDKTPVIAFTGKDGVGKSTAAVLTKQLYGRAKLLSFSTPLKIACSALFNLDKECYNPTKIDQLIPSLNLTPREILQKVRTDVFRDQLYTLFPNITIPKQTLSTSVFYNTAIKYFKTNTPIIVDDCNSEDEVKCINELGGIVIKIMRDVRSDTVITYISDTGCFVDEIIINNGSEAQLQSKIKKILISSLIKYYSESILESSSEESLLESSSFFILALITPTHKLASFLSRA